MNMRERAYWRELFDAIIHVRGERERIAKAIGVVAVTLSRWASGESSPRPRYLSPLVQAIPDEHRSAFQTSIAQEFPSHHFNEPMQEDLSDEPIQDHTRFSIPFQFVSRILATRATDAPHQVSWVMIQQILQHALLHLASDGQGLKITVILCRPPRDNGIICSLREKVALGTYPWRENVEEQVRFLGADTLVGYTVATARSHQVRDLTVNPTFLPYLRDEHEISAAACPIMWHSHIAGCVLFSSTAVGTFESDALMVLLQAYTNLIALALAESDFYDVSLIQLRVMPTFKDQEQYLASFQRRVIALMKESVSSEYPLTRMKAEKIAWQQIETLLLAYYSRSSCEHDTQAHESAKSDPLNEQDHAHKNYDDRGLHDTFPLQKGKTYDNNTRI